jgi:hypothetical protein
VPVEEALDQPAVPPLALHEHGGGPAPAAAEEGRATSSLVCGEHAGSCARPRRLATVAAARPLHAVHIFRLRKVNMQIVVAAVPSQEAITRDNVTLRVDAVVYYRVIDPFKAIVNVQNYTFAVAQVAQTSLRSVIGQSDMDMMLSERDKVNAHLKDVIDEPTEGPWGIRVERVEVKDVSLPESMKRSMSRQAEAERERRARIISADGEYQASKKLAQAASVMAADPAALQLRLLQTVVEVAAEKNSTLVMPVPVELLRFFDRAAPANGQVQPAAADSQDADAPAPVPDVPAVTTPAGPAADTALTARPLNGAPNRPAST